MYTLTLQRLLSKRTGDDKIKAQIEYIVGRGLGGSRGKTWKADIQYMPAHQKANGWLFGCQITFEKTSGQRGGEAEYKQWEEIKAMIYQSGAGAKFQGNNWLIVNGNNAATPPNDMSYEIDRQANIVRFERPITCSLPPQTSSGTNFEKHTQPNPEPPIEPADFNGVIGGVTDALTRILNGVRDIESFGPAKKWEDLKVPPELMGPDSDQHLAQHPAWMNLYGVNPQIRIILSNIQRAQETNGESRNHAVLFGHAGCGKTTTMFALEQMYGRDAVLKLDATSTTRAGLEKLFFDQLHEIPPLVFMEEAEKADPEALKIWLGALDDRGEIRKVNFKVNKLRAVKVLFICSVNNKAQFDRMMGSDGSEAGALSSRCVTQVYYPRPSQAVMFQILSKEIREKGGREEWIAPAIALGEQLGVTDPRVVRSFLAGGNRLLNGSYQHDWKATWDAQRVFNKEQK